MVTSCGTGVGTIGPLPGDPDNNVTLSASPAFGGIDIAWTYPVSNPHAVSHTLLFRSNASNFNSAVEIAVVSGSTYYDKLPTGVTYYYWIQLVSINGTVGELIGPASAMARALVNDVIDAITGEIDDSVLSDTLRTKINLIPTIEFDLIKEVNDRIAESAAVSSFFAQLQAFTDDVHALILSEITTRTTADSAQINVIDAIGVSVEGNSSALAIEKIVRASADDASSVLFTALQSIVTDPTTGLVSTRATLINEYQTSTSITAAFASFKTAITTEFVDATSAAVGIEAKARSEADKASADLIIKLESTVDDPTTGVDATRATLLNKYTTTTDADTAAATLNTQLRAYTNLGSSTFLQATPPTKRGQDPKTGANVPLQQDDVWYDSSGSPPKNTLNIWNGGSWVPSVDASIEGAAVAAVSTLESTMIGFCTKNGAATSAETESTCISSGGEWHGGFPLAKAVKQVTVVGPSGEVATVETAASAQYTLNDGLKNQYTVKLTNGDLIGGFGLYGDSTGIEAGFDVNKFWIGSPTAGGNRPFSLVNGVVSINRLRITGLVPLSETIYFLNGAASGSFAHGSGRHVIVYAALGTKSGYPIAGIRVTLMTTNALGWAAHMYTNTGIGFTGLAAVQFGYI